MKGKSAGKREKGTHTRTVSLVWSTVIAQKNKICPNQNGKEVFQETPRPPTK